MYFQIKELILWSKRGLPPRRVIFEPGNVNVISGASKTGKSAVVPIIDYCLASDKCAIPVGVIRDACSWFGILIDTIEGLKLLARREPGEQQQTGDMFLLEDSTIVVPREISERHSNTASVKAMLDRLAGLSAVGFDPESESGFKGRPSFRDLVAFNFQPQNIIANPDVMFFKADTTEHREKLKTIFPYVLGAITPELLSSRWELDRLTRLLRKKEAELRAATGAVTAWRAEALGWCRQAVELGLLPIDTSFPDDWSKIIELLRSILNSDARVALPSIESIDLTLARLVDLRSEEGIAAQSVSDNRQRLNELRRLAQGGAAYGAAIRIQRDRLGLSAWLRGLEQENGDPIAALGPEGRGKLDKLATALEGIELQIHSHPGFAEILDREVLRLRGLTERNIEKLAEVRREINVLEGNSEEARAAAYRSDQLQRFLGRLEQAIALYDRTDTNTDLQDEIRSITSQMVDLRRVISEQDIARRTQNALRTVETIAATIIPKLDAEWPNSPIQISIEDLTIKVLNGPRADYLWEIGSGANWLAYHVALSLSLQHFFLDQPNHPVPGVLVYDQPSQVYFPRRLAGERTEGELTWNDEDVEAVRRVFIALAEEALRSPGRLQIIVLDHADSEVWGGVPGVTLIEEWRGGLKLVPDIWLAEQVPPSDAL
jgi:hypothetical protein